MAFMALLPIIVITQVKGLKFGLILSAIFGVVSFAIAFTMRSVLSPIFINPLVSIVPRLFIGLTTYYSGKFVGFLLSKSKKLNSKLSDSIKYGVSGAVGVCTNTTLVLGMMYLIFRGQTIGGVNIGWALIVFIISTNFVIELVVTTILCIPISLAVNKIIRIKTPNTSVKTDVIVEKYEETIEEVKEKND